MSRASPLSPTPTRMLLPSQVRLPAGMFGADILGLAFEVLWMWNDAAEWSITTLIQIYLLVML